MKGVVLVTGASSGIGRAISVALVRRGYTVFGAARARKDTWPEGVSFIQMDVTDESSVRGALESIRCSHGSLYALINSAGIGLLGAVEDSSSDEIRVLFDTNLVGLHCVCRHSLNLLRARQGSYIINITSMAAQMGLPFRGIYCASKFAVEGYSEALSQEVANDGIRVVILEPGDVRTAINSHRLVVAKVSESNRELHDSIQKQVNGEVDEGLDPSEIARVVVRILETNKPRLRYRVSRPRAALAYYLMRVLPGRWFEAIIQRHYKI